ncbi:MAG TPA: hypothetical protein DHU75_04135 [Rikenellaceae bacterium]|nr:hypothetical protein [Rikenellaceae bacterium]
MNEQPTISVAILTYKQEKTIRQTLNSVICQKGDFSLEVIIGDDHSPDGNRAICEEFAANYPFGGRVYVKLLPDEPNKGIMGNFARIMKHCTGDYVAICAGDDYWCDEYKLQKQLNYFSIYPDVGVVSTSGYKLLVRSNKLIPNAIAPYQPFLDGDVRKFYFSPDYKGGVYAMPLTLLIKRKILNYVDFDEYVRRKFPVEDFPMQAVMSQHCKWGHIPDLTVVYRVYKGSATFISYDDPNYMNYFKGLADIRRYLNELFPLDACITEDMLQEDLFYKEFLLLLHQWRYQDAKALAQQCALHTPKVQLTREMTKNPLLFVLFRAYKEFYKHKELMKRI